MGESVFREKNILDIVIILLYFLFIIRQFKVYNKINHRIGFFAFSLGLLHFSITFASYQFILGHQGIIDAKHYYITPLMSDSFSMLNFDIGTSFIVILNYFLVKILNLSFLGCFLVFSFISYLGCIKLLDVIIHATDRYYNFWYLSLFMFGMHFWTTSIGKDALTFYAMSSLCYNLYFNKPKQYYILPVMLLGLVRIHILICVLIGGGIGYVFTNKKIKLQHKVIIATFIASLLIFLVPIFLDRLDIDSVEAAENRMQRSVDSNLSGGAGVDLSGSNIVFRWISYMYRPFILEARNAMMLISAIENLLWLYFSFIIIKYLRINIGNRNTSYIVWSYIGIIIVCTLPLAYSLSNFGISMRQKIMVAPFLISLLFILKYKKIDL